MPTEIEIENIVLVTIDDKHVSAVVIDIILNAGTVKSYDVAYFDADMIIRTAVCPAFMVSLP